jgi:hypothetical protein
MGKRRVQIIVLALIILICLAVAVSAVAIGVSPSSLGFQLEKGESDKKTVQVSTNSQSGLPFSLEESESIRNLVIIEPSKGVVDVKKAAKINISASAPDGVPPGNYSGFIIVTAMPGGAESPGSSVSAGVALRINVEIVGVTAKAKVADVAAEAIQKAAPAEDLAQRMEEGRPANAEGEAAGIGNEITGNAAAGGGGAFGTALISVAALVTAIIVMILVLNTVRPYPQAKPEATAKTSPGPSFGTGREERIKR